MGLPKRELYLTRYSKDPEEVLLLSAYPLVKHETCWGYPNPPYPLGYDIFVPLSVMPGLTFEEGPIKVDLVPSETEDSGLWMVCYNDYFGNELHVCNFKPEKWGR